jgi:branched-subunit amino acid transport protein AzlD
MKKFIEFSLIWYSQQMAIPFWVVGHVHLSISTYKDIQEIIASLGLNLLVAIGFIIDYKKTTKNYEK